MILYQHETNVDTIVCMLDQVDNCIPSSRQIIKNVSDQTLFKLREKYSVLVSKNLDEMLEFASKSFKIALIVPTGIDILDCNSINITVNEDFQIVNLIDYVKDINLNKAEKNDLVTNIFFLDGTSEEKFEKGLAWQNKKFTLGLNSFYPVNNELVYNLNLSKIRQLVTPAAGLNWINYLNRYGYDSTTTVRFYDYSYMALDCMREIIQNYKGDSYKDFIKELGSKKFNFINKEWDYNFASMYHDDDPINWIDITNTVNFEFLHLNILEQIEIEDLVKPGENIFINFSNIFSYYPSSSFYSLQSRIDAESRILESLKAYDCYIGFISRAGDAYCMYHSARAGHIKDFDNSAKLKLPTWHENN